MDIPKKNLEFRELHESGCFVIPNPWDAGTTIFLQSLGFKALATTSAGLAFSLGSQDDVGTVTLNDTLQNIRDIVSATSLPVNADFQNGYSDSPEGLAENVRRCIDTGVAGLSIEDKTGGRLTPLYARELAIERIKAARAAIDSKEESVFLTGRCEAWLVGDDTPLATSIDRLVDYAEAGADCLFAPGVSDSDEIRTIVKAVHPKPVNVLISGAKPKMTASRLEDIGVRRVSVGSALARAAWGAFIRASKNIVENDSFLDLSAAASFAELDEVFRKL